MKVAQNDKTNPNTRSVRPPHVPSIANMQPFPSFSSVRKCQTSGKHSRMFFPYAGIVQHHVRSRLALPVVLLCTCLLCIYCFSPLFSSVDPVTMLMPLWSTTSPTTPPSCLSNQASPPLDHQISPTLLSTTCIRVV